MRTHREEAAALVRHIDSADLPRGPFRRLRTLLESWGKDYYPGTHVVLQRLCAAEETYLRALEDAKFILEEVK